jgi:hypothetical protein
MSTTTTTSQQFSLNLNDWWKGLIMAVGGAVFQIIVDTIQLGSLTFDWQRIGMAALGAIVVYLSKNFFTPSAIVVKDVPKETVEAVKEGEARVVVTKQ